MADISRKRRRSLLLVGESSQPKKFKIARPVSQAQGDSNGSVAAIQEQREDLPIAPGKQAIIEEIRKHSVTILLGETGSGKTTQVPQYILESGLARNGVIAVTQPRRVAATSLAHRVAVEQNTSLGQLVGYAVRFDEKHSLKTRIKYMTDGMLVREFMSDPTLSKYSVIIVDEAHERTLRTDLLIAKLKSILSLRNSPSAKVNGNTNASNPIKIIIMSATLDAEKFSTFFPSANIVYVKGRQHPVKIFHSTEGQLDYLDAALRTFFQIHTDRPPGDVLIFLPGQDDIQSLQKSIELFAKLLPVDRDAVLICAMFAAQENSKNIAVFKPTPPNMRKCILATNIAETSITIPGVKYVIDTGKCKEKQYLARISGGGFDTLLTRDITKSSAIQRAGRAGRQGMGFCFRLYTEESYKSMKECGEPEILRCSLNSSILSLRCSGLNLEELELLDKPDQESIVSALKTLWVLRAISDGQNITPTGRIMATFPLEPQYACAIVASETYHCTSEVLDIVSILTASSKIFLDISEKREAISDARKKFQHASGDHMTILRAFRAYNEIKKTGLEFGKRDWCREQFLNEKAFIEAKNIRDQLAMTCRKAGLNPLLSVNDKDDPIIRSFGHGLVANSALLHPDGSYKQTVGQVVVKIHPSSSLYNKKVPAIIYDELVYTNQIYARGVSEISKSFFLSLPAFTQRTA